MPSIFGPEPPPSNPRFGPVVRAKRPRAPKMQGELIDLAARQSAKTALEQQAQLAEKLAAYGLQSDMELIGEGVQTVAARIDKVSDIVFELREKSAEERRQSIARHDALNTELAELRAHVFEEGRKMQKRLIIYGAVALGQWLFIGLLLLKVI